MKKWIKAFFLALVLFCATLFVFGALTWAVVLHPEFVIGFMVIGLFASLVVVVWTMSHE